MSKRGTAISPTILGAAARRVGLKANAGRVTIVRAVAAALGRDVPPGKDAQRRWLMAFNASTPPPPPAKKRATASPQSAANSDEFLLSYEWRRLRYAVLCEQGRRCQCCGATPDTGAVMHVDHIKPRRLFPELALEKSNLQVLCHECNHGKGNWDQTDWRPEPAQPLPPPPRLVKGPRLHGPVKVIDAASGIISEVEHLDAQYCRHVG